MRCVSFCTAKSYSLNGLTNFFKNRKFPTKLYRHVLHVSIPNQSANLFIFSHGCFVSWNLKRKEELKLLQEIKAFSTDPLDRIEIDYFSFKYGEETTVETHERFNADVITLESDNVQIKLAISYGLAESIKLEYYEELIKNTIKKNSQLPEELAKTGKILLSRKAISQRMGEIFIEMSSVNLNSGYLDVPEYFWRFPNLESYYTMTEQFLDITRRVAALNQRLDVLHQFFDMLTGQLQFQHSTLLEIIIILLIFIEIVISLVQFHVF
ncbi:MAG: RMD1 family protein [Gammaproteobacteria bacterium]|nr:RMD1 family protein [Gammaproteobacteria bacterium]